MKKLFVSSGVMFSLLLLGGCVTAKPGSPEAQALALQKIEEQKVERAEKIVSDIPSWCNDLPKSDMALYACGRGNSSSMNIAVTRATLDAKRKLAEPIGSQISARIEDFLSATGTGDNEEILQRTELVSKNVIKEAQLTGYREIEAETQNIGSKFQHYVLLEYPIGPANKALLDQMKKDEVLRTQEAADAAMAELEAEINKKKSQ